jgi:hypothetical protein
VSSKQIVFKQITNKQQQKPLPFGGEYSLAGALAQSDSEKIEKLQRQMEQVQKQLRELQGEIAQ